MGRRVAIPWHACFRSLPASSTSSFVLPRWPELMGDTTHSVGTTLRIVTGALIGLAALPVVFTLLRSRKPELGTPQMALSLRVRSIVAHVLAGVLIIGTAISEIWLSLDNAGQYLFAIYGAAAAIALLGFFAFYLSFVAELPPPPPKPIKAKKPRGPSSASAAARRATKLTKTLRAKTQVDEDEDDETEADEAEENRDRRSRRSRQASQNQDRRGNCRSRRAETVEAKLAKRAAKKTVQAKRPAPAKASDGRGPGEPQSDAIRPERVQGADCATAAQPGRGRTGCGAAYPRWRRRWTKRRVISPGGEDFPW